MEKKVYKLWIKDVDELHSHILAALDELDQRVIDMTVRQDDITEVHYFKRKTRGL